MTNQTPRKFSILDAAFTVLLVATGGFAFPIAAIIFALNVWIGMTQSLSSPMETSPSDTCYCSQ